MSISKHRHIICSPLQLYHLLRFKRRPISTLHSFVDLPVSIAGRRTRRRAILPYPLRISVADKMNTHKHTSHHPTAPSMHTYNIIYLVQIIISENAMVQLENCRKTLRRVQCISRSLRALRVPIRRYGMPRHIACDDGVYHYLRSHAARIGLPASWPPSSPSSSAHRAARR